MDNGVSTIWKELQGIFTLIGGFLGWFLGGFDGLIYALVVFVATDYVTGVMCAIAAHELSSEIGFKGIAKKIAIFLIVGVANILDTEILGRGAVLRTAAVFFYVSNEGISILENAVKLGLPVPLKVQRALKELKNKAENAENKESEENKEN